MIDRVMLTIRRIQGIAWPQTQQNQRRVLLVLSVVALFALALLAGRWLRVPAVQDKDSLQVSLALFANVAGVPDMAFARQDTINVGLNDAFDIINPLYSSGDGEADAVSLIFESLVYLDEQGQPLSRLASAWSFDAASHQLTFILHTDHIFRDGRSVDASDVVFTYQCLLANSYDGPLQGRLAGIIAVGAGDTASRVVFTLADSVEQPDYRAFTVGILKSDYYACSLDRVYEIRDNKLPPEGSGSFEMISQTPALVTMQRRSGYGGTVQLINLRQVASEDKYAMLKNGELDIVRNQWDTRMQERSGSLTGYNFNLLNVSVDDYFLVNPEPQASNIIQRPSQRLAVLLSAAGKELSALQKSSLQELAGRSLKLYYFQGISEQTLQHNREKADSIAAELQASGLSVDVMPTAWPDLASRATSGNYDILLLPATSNSRLPRQIVILGDPVQPSASAWIAGYQTEVYITSKRLAQLTINSMGHPFAAAAGTWTDHLENIRFLASDGSFYEEGTP